jgi:hypothetical protein
MTKSAQSTKCPRCGSAATGRFCASCGAVLEGSACAECGKPLSGGSRFCHHCGAPAGDTVRASAPMRNALAWLVPGIAVLALVAFLIGQRVGRGSSPSDAESTAPLSGDGGRASDISQMSLDERASRLFNRVMQYSEQGKLDSARIFAPMAIQSYEMLGSLDAHNRYDIGMIATVTGDAALARAEADSILARDRNHLLGLVLAIKAAALRGDETGRAALRRRLVTAEPAGRAKKLKEYDEHKADIDAALKDPRSAKP